MLDVVVVGNPHGVFVEPLRQILIANTERLQGCDRGRVRIHPLVVFLGHILSDKAPTCITAAWVLDHRVHVDAK